MVVPQELTPEVWAALPPAVAALLGWQAEQIRILTQRVAELEVKLGKDSTNSSLPPSAAHPHAMPPRPKPNGRRRPGGQPGHPQPLRALLPTDQCQQVVRWVPTACRRCGRGLTGSDPQPLRHQVWELPDFQPSVTEYQQHRLVCACGCSSCGPLPAGVPSGQAGLLDSSPSPVYSWPASVSPNAGPHFLSLILNQPASRRLAGRVAEPRRRRRAAGLRRTGPTTAARPPCCTWMNHRPSKARPRPGFRLRRCHLHLLRLPHQSGCRSAAASAGRHVRRRDPLRPGTDVLGFGRPLAVVLFHLKPRLPGSVRRSVPRRQTSRPRPLAAD